MKRLLRLSHRAVAMLIGACFHQPAPPNAPYPLPQIVIPLEPIPGKWTEESYLP